MMGLVCTDGAKALIFDSAQEENCHPSYLVSFSPHSSKLRQLCLDQCHLKHRARAVVWDAL